MADKAKVFTSGRSQAVRLPKEFRFKGNLAMITYYSIVFTISFVEYQCTVIICIGKIKPLENLFNIH
jgi:hypothetical protein